MTSESVCPSCQTLKPCTRGWPADVPRPVPDGPICDDCWDSVRRYAVLQASAMLDPVVHDHELPGEDGDA